MRIHYNLTGAARKALVTAISEELNQPAHYQGAPTFAYEVGGHQIDKAGTLEGADNHGLVADLLGLHDFKAEREEYDTMPLDEESKVPDDVGDTRNRLPWAAGSVPIMTSRSLWHTPSRKATT